MQMLACSAPLAHRPGTAVHRPRAGAVLGPLGVHAAWATPRHSKGRGVRCRAAGGDGVGLEPELRQAIDTFVSANKIVVFMKGNRQMPQCGFSNRVVQILNSMGVPYETVDVLADDRIRTGMKEYSMWPTFPQVYIDGEFYGGCDIVTEKFTSGELAEDLERALSS